MCGRYSWSTCNGSEFGSLGLDELATFKPSFNRAPGQLHPAIKKSGDYSEWSCMWWGTPPHSSHNFPINARSESVLQKAIFKQSFNTQRCLIPADGFFEWQLIETQKYPHFIHLPDSSIFAFGGIWKDFLIDQDISSSFSIITRNAPSNLLHLHHRAPLIVMEEHWKKWLCPSTPMSEVIKILASQPYPLTFYQVDSRVNSSRNDDAGLLRPKSEKQSTLF